MGYTHIQLQTEAGISFMQSHERKCGISLMQSHEKEAGMQCE